MGTEGRRATDTDDKELLAQGQSSSASDDLRSILDSDSDDN